MDNKKDIGKLFKERLDSLESKPNDAIWGALEEQLKKDNKKAFPFWLKLTSMGVLALLLSLIFYQLNTSNTNTLKTTEETNISNKPININKDNTKDEILLKADTLNKHTTDANVSKDSSLIKNSTLPVIEDTTVYQKNNLKRQDTKTSTIVSQQNNQNKSSSNTNSNLTSNSSTITQSSSNSSLVSSSSSVLNSSSNSNSVSYSNSIVNLTSNTVSNQHIKKRNLQLNSSSILAENLLKSKGINAIGNPSISLDLIPFSIESIEEIEAISAEQNYSLETFGGILLFNAPSNSSLDNQLNENKKSGNVSFNYGAAIRFRLSEKTSIKLGIAKTDLVYVTENVASTNEEGNIISLNNILGLDLDFNALNNINTNNLLGGSSSIDLRQDYSYLEIPVEIDYRLINKKINVDIFGGLSLLALNENTIYAQSSNSNKVDIGKANNLNKVNLSLNTGTNFSTHLFENIELNLRPTFKYYFKTIGKSNIKFNPFTFGVNIGLSYSF